MMKLKLDEAGHVLVLDGKPVYVHDDGKEAAVATITALNSKAKGDRGQEAAGPVAPKAA